MGIIEHDDIVGVSTLKGYTFCTKCMGEVSDFKEQFIITVSEIETADRTYWCDCCKEALK